MKKLIKVFGILLVVFAVILAGGFFYIKNMELPEVAVGEFQLGSVADGSYEGEFSAGVVSAAVTVTVKDKKVVDIVINRHENGLGKKAERIVEDIIEKQSLNVEAVSGATLSSNVIRKAVEEAVATK
ncbi:MAG: FMN-binding protein [Clostridia bacterium]|jgi:uncharacterized protein with FMN-binding domain|nr:FMN-binding protein [Clostridia bacterium]